MLWTLARYGWSFLVHGGAGFRSWAYRSPGIAKNYEPLYIPEWNRSDWRIGEEAR